MAAVDAARSTGQGSGCIAASRPRNSDGGISGVIAGAAPVSAGAVGSNATRRPARAARSSTISAACTRRVQPVAEAQPLSSTSSTGPVPGECGAGVQYRSGQADDDQSGGDAAEQQQPPRRARRGFLAGFQSEQKANGREHFPARRRWRDPQQPPEQGQRGQRQQDPRCGEDHDRAKTIAKANSLRRTTASYTSR